jgi:diguanylate cyclase (GGDEF)-like protein
MSDAFEARRTALHQQFRNRTVHQSSVLNDLSMRSQVAGTSNSQEQIRWIAHSLAGAAGTFGFEKVSATAAELERSIGNSVAFADLARGCQAVISTIREATASHPSPTLRRHTDDQPIEMAGDLAPLPIPVPAAADRTQEGILVLAPARRYPELASVVTGLGYLPIDAASSVDPSVVKNGKVAAALICDEVDGALQVARNYSLHIPVLMLSAAPTFHRQLAATRAGVSGILNDPLDVVELADWLGDVAPRHSERPYSILIIDGDRLLGEAYALELQAAGMLTEVLSDGTQALERIAAFSPDLVLLDIHLPEINGIDLAKVIRQSRRELSLPIVFVSTESDPHLQLEARVRGGDDFIHKPIDPRTLVSLVTLRAQRAMALRSLLERDSLTGLVTYSKFMTRLSHEMERCRRTGSEIALAIIDLDNLRDINHQLGHAQGDRILRGLAQALVGRLRRIDVVARYSGDQFAIILLDTNPDTIRPVLEQIREGFAALPFGKPEAPISASISIGLAGTRSHDGLEELVLAATKAAQAAKSAGGNCIEIVTEKP